MFKLNVWYYNVTHLYEVDYRLLCHISSILYEIFMELFLSRQNDQIAPVLDTCGWRCSVTPLSLSLHTAQQNPHMISDKLVKSLNETYYQQVM